jgi:ferredoxin-NADP reductase
MRGYSINSAPDDGEPTFTKSNPTGPVYYIAGPPQMVAGLRAMLNKAGGDDDDIRTEGFTGY